MTGRWFSPGTPVSPTNKTDRHDITEIVLKVALNTTTRTRYMVLNKYVNNNCISTMPLLYLINYDQIPHLL